MIDSVPSAATLGVEYGLMKLHPIEQTSMFRIFDLVYGTWEQTKRDMYHLEGMEPIVWLTVWSWVVYRGVPDVI